jgi:hypothetical protein
VRAYFIWAVSLLLAMLVIAHLLRYEPMGSANNAQLATVWDRWLQRVCLISFLKDNRLSCSVDAFTKNVPAATGPTKGTFGTIEEMREAGFSEREILDWVDTEIKSKRQQGMSDEALAKHLFGPSSPRKK